MGCQTAPIVTASRHPGLPESVCPGYADRDSRNGLGRSADGRAPVRRAVHRDQPRPAGPAHSQDPGSGGAAGPTNRRRSHRGAVMAAPVLKYQLILWTSTIPASKGSPPRSSCGSATAPSRTSRAIPPRAAAFLGARALRRHPGRAQVDVPHRLRRPPNPLGARGQGSAQDVPAMAQGRHCGGPCERQPLPGRRRGPSPRWTDSSCRMPPDNAYQRTTGDGHDGSTRSATGRCSGPARQRSA